MVFSDICEDGPQGPAIRASAVRQQHLGYLAQHAPEVKFAGPLLDAAGAATGSLVIFEAADETAAKAFCAADPYAKAGLFASVEIRPLKAVMGAWLA
jgi:uncharacterized protein YciI